MADQEVVVSQETQINPNAGAMKIDGEIVFASEYEKLTRSTVFDTDSYKPSMSPQYPDNVSVVNSYGESRGGVFEDVMHLGVQPVIDKLAEGVNMREVNFAREMWEAHGVPFRHAAYEMWKHIVNEHGGRLPLTIRAVPEGAVLPTRNPPVQGVEHRREDHTRPDDLDRDPAPAVNVVHELGRYHELAHP